MVCRSIVVLASALALTGCGAGWDCDAVDRELANHERLVGPLVADIAASVGSDNNCNEGAYGYTVATMRPGVTIEDVAARLRRAGWANGKPDADGVPGEAVLTLTRDGETYRASIYRRPPASGVTELAVVTDHE